MNELLFTLYGSESCESIKVSELIKITKNECYARIENSGSEGFYVEIARWNPDIRKYQRFAFSKFLGGEISDWDAKTCAEKITVYLNDNWNVSDDISLIHEMEDWQIEKEYLLINLNKIKDAIEKRGFVFKHELESWTDTLLDILEEEYNLETLLINLFPEFQKKGI